MDSKSISTILMVGVILLLIIATALDFFAFDRARKSVSITAFSISAAVLTGLAIILMGIAAFMGGYGFFSIAPILLFISGLLLVVAIILDVVGEIRAGQGDPKDAAAAVLFAGIFALISMVLIIIAIIVHGVTAAAEEVAESPAGQTLINTIAANPELLLV